MSNTPALEVHADWLRVPLGGGDHADFHHRWLRHNCDRERHPRTGERTRCSSELPDDLSPRTARLTDDRLELTWPDGHVSTYPLTWLRAHDTFVRLLRDPAHHVRVGLGRGDWLIYDNHRTLHARTGFTGPRWLRGVYFDE